MWSATTGNKKKMWTKINNMMPKIIIISWGENPKQINFMKDNTIELHIKKMSL